MILENLNQNFYENFAKNKILHENKHLASNLEDRQFIEDHEMMALSSENGHFNFPGVKFSNPGLYG
jgi:hypothetical protein